MTSNAFDAMPCAEVPQRVQEGGCVMRSFSILRKLLAIAALAFLPMVLSAETFDDGTYTWYWSTTGHYDEYYNWVTDSVYVYDVDPAPVGEVTVPASFNDGDTDFPVTEIGSCLFYWNSGITKVTLPDTVEIIGSDAFNGCDNLETVNFPSALEVIDGNAFSDCAKLSVIQLPEKLEEIGYSAFSYTSISNFTIPASVKTIGGGAFDGTPWDTNHADDDYAVQDGWLLKVKSDLTNIVIPGDVKTMCENALPYTVEKIDFGSLAEIPGDMCSWYEDLVEITLGASVTNIGYNAFYYCPNLAKINGGENVLEVGYNAFSGCGALAAIPFAKAEYFGGSAFYGCTNLTEVVLPDTLEYVDTYCFGDCTGINSLTIGKGLDSVPYACFYGCTSLVTVDLPDSVTYISSYAFEDCANLESVTGGNGLDGNSLGSDVFAGTKLIENEFAQVGPVLLKYNGNGGAVVIPEAVKYFTDSYSYYNGPFKGVSNITSVAFSADFEDFNLYWFQSSGSQFGDTLDTLNSVIVPANDSYYASVDGLVYNKAITQLCFVPKARSGAIVVPDTVTSIAYGAFQDCDKITSVKLPCGLTYIDSYTFSGCSALTSIALPAKLSSVGSYAFSGCTSLETVTGGEKVQRVGMFAFDDTPWFQNNSAEFIKLGQYLIRYQGAATDVSIPAGIKYFASDAFTNLLTKITIGPDVKKIPDDAFCDQDALAAVVMGANVESIGSGAFCYCTNLTEFVCNAALKAIGSWAFEGCYNLKSVTFNNGLESIGNGAFYDCVALASVSLPDSLIEIDDSAFECCEGLSSVAFGAGLELIGSGAFYYCTNLTAIAIPANVSIIHGNAFGDCTNLTSVTGCEGLEYVGDGAFYGTTWYAGIQDAEFVMIGSFLVKYNGNGGEVTLPANTVAVGFDAFDNDWVYNEDTGYYEEVVREYTAINIPAKFENSGFDLSDLAHLNGVKAININAAHPDFASNDGIVYTKNLQELVVCPFYRTAAVTVPSSVFKIGDNAFDGRESIPSVALPDKLKEIGNSAFCGCTNLTAITIPDTVTYIGDGAFSDCCNLAAVNLPAKLESLGSYAFNGCSLISSVNIPEGVKSLSYGTFHWCTNLTTVAGGNGLTSMGSSYGGVFAYTPWLDAQTNEFVVLGSLLLKWDYDVNENSDVVVPAGVKYVGGWFCDDRITSITLGDKVEDLYVDTFDSCSRLTNITVSASNKNFATVDGVLYDKSLTTLICYPNGRKDKTFVVPDSVIAIGEYAFYNNDYLEEVSLGAKTIELGYEAFCNCDRLKIVNGLEDVRFFGSDALYGTALVNDAGASEFVLYGSVLVAYNGTGGDVVIPANVKSGIDNIYWANVKNFTSITIPAGYDGDLGYFVFRGCKKLKAVNVASGNKLYSSADGVLYDAEMETLLFCPAARGGAFAIPSGVSYVGAFAFADSAIESVSIPDSVERIGNYAFEDCINLATVTGGFGLEEADSDAFLNTPFYIGDPCAVAMQLIRVGNIVFGYRGELPENLVIPEGVTVINRSAFGGGSEYSIKTLSIPSTLERIGNYAFYGNFALETLVLPDTLETLGYEAFAGCGLKSIDFGAGIGCIAESAFADNDELESIDIPDNVRRIEGYAFGGCSKLAEVLGCEGVTYIAEDAFDGTLYQQKWDGGEFQLKIIADKVLIGYTGLCPASIVIPEGITRIADSAFEGCRQITSVSIPSTLVAIDDYAFAGCDSLAAVALPAEIETIGDGAFAECSKLASVTGAGSDLCFVGEDAFLATPFLDNGAAGCVTIGNVAVGCRGIAAGGALAVPDGVQYIADGAFRGCAMGSVSLPGSLFEISTSAFADCANLKSVTIPRRVEYVGANAFSGCYSLTSIVLANPDVELASSSFVGCYALSSVKLADGYKLVGWIADEHYEFAADDYSPFMLADANNWTVAADWTLVVCEDPESNMFTGVEATQYTGFLTTADDGIGGTILVKVGKVNNKGVCKVTVTLVPYGDKKKSIKGEYNVASGAVVDKDGLLGGLKIGVNGLSGTIAGMKVSAARDPSKAKGGDAGKDLLNSLKGKVWTAAFSSVPLVRNAEIPAFARGYSTFAFTVAGNGKTKVTGTLADGTKVSANSQVVVGDANLSVPFVFAKKNENIGFVFWFNKSGSPIALTELGNWESKDFTIGLECIDFDSLVAVKNGAAEFVCDEDDIPASLGNVLVDFLPNGETVTVAGDKWNTAKGAKIAYKNGVFDEVAYSKSVAKGNTNKSSLKLSYKSKDASIKGSFILYTLADGKVKKNKLTVTGNVVNGTAYGTAVLKKVGSMAVEVQR